VAGKAGKRQNSKYKRVRIFQPETTAFSRNLTSQPARNPILSDSYGADLASQYRLLQAERAMQNAAFRQKQTCPLRHCLRRCPQNTIKMLC
jgi:hypothetical protein